MLSSAISIVRSWLTDRPAQISNTYAGGPTVPAGIGPTLLEISRSNRVPHLSVCGGQALCSTCRVEILAGGETLDSPADAELRLLRLIGAPSTVRLACQIRPKSSMTVARVLKPEEHTITPRGAAKVEAAGVDREAATRLPAKNKTGLPNVRHRAKHPRHHTKDKQRFVVSVIAYDSLH
jgi:adenylate cyclase